MEASIRIQDVDTSNVCIGDSPAPQIASERLVPRTKSSISKVRNLHGELPQQQRRPTLYPIPPASALRRLKYCSVRPPNPPIWLINAVLAFNLFSLVHDCESQGDWLSFVLCANQGRVNTGLTGGQHLSMHLFCVCFFLNGGTVPTA